MTSLIEQAAKIATLAHAGQTRKDDDTPYIVHPYMVAMDLVRHAFPDMYVAAALVHDVLEDTKYSADDLRATLGDEVFQIVMMLTEDKALPWEERKGRYIESVRQGTEGVKAVSIADKIHNLESLLVAYDKQGPDLWKKFNRGKEKKLWFEESMLSMFKETWQHALVSEYEKLVERMKMLD